MVRRLLVGLGKGLLVGGALALLLIYGAGLSAFGAGLAYLMAAVTGVVTGLIAGKPIWADDARIEAGLKAVVGALVGAAVMFGLRKWVGVSVDLGAFGQGVLGELPLTSLPVIATLLALFYELDNSGGDGGEKKQGAQKQRIAAESSGSSALEEDELDADEASAPAAREKR